MLQNHSKAALIIIAALSLALFSCMGQKRWQSSTIQSGFSDMDMKKLTYPSQNYASDIEVELTFSDDTLSAYLNLFTQIAKETDDDPQKTKVILSSKSKTHPFILHRLQGGQRLKVPKESLTKFIEILSESSSVTITLQNGFHVKIKTHSFKEHLEELKKPQSRLISNDPIGIAL